MRLLNSVSMVMAAMLLLAFSSPVFAGKEDSNIEKSAKHTYMFKRYLKNDSINVKSVDGNVILTGTVSRELHKSLAQETVSELEGVKSVDNRLVVKGVVPTTNSDLWILDRIKVTLLFHRSVDAGTVEVDVKDGIVILRGNAISKEQKDLTTEYVKDVDGVKDVINNMKVVTVVKHKRTLGDKIDDSSITAEIKMSLAYHRSTSALRTSVKTINGVVTLTGKVKTEIERDLATKYAEDVDGVEQVKNLMTVE